MERRVTSHTEEEEMNQRRRLLSLARKGDEKAISRLLELYQVHVYSGDKLRTLKSRQSPAVKKQPKKRVPAPPAKKQGVATSTTKRAKKRPRPHPSGSAHKRKTQGKTAKKTKHR